MRYIYYIILIVLVLSAALVYELLSSSVTPKDTAMVINGRVITIKEFNRLQSSPPLYLKTREDVIDSIVTRELLIQEAQREGIDKEEAFRQSIQNFYEQSLIKLLLDRKFNSAKISVSDSELDRYLSFLGRKVRVTVSTADTVKDANAGNFRDVRTREVAFDNLSSFIRERLVRLKEGQSTEPIGKGGKFVVVRLDKLEGPPQAPPSEKKREYVKIMLKGEKTERLVSRWVDGLRQKASVKIMLKRKDKD